MTSQSALTRRLALTLLAVLVVDLLLISVVAAFMAPVLLRVTAGLSPVGSGLVWLGSIGALLITFVLLQFRIVRGATLASVDYTLADESNYGDLNERVARLAQIADTEPPAVGVVDTSVANCFSVGGQDPVLVVSEGLLEQLADDELDAVLAHELAHLLNRDATVMTLATFLPTMVSDEPIAGLPRWARTNVFGGLLVFMAVMSLGSVTTANPAVVVGTFAVSVVAGGVILGVLATPVVYLSHRLSHDREFVADRVGAELSGNPGALASALEKLDDDISETPSRDLRSTGSLVTELCLLPRGFVSDDEGVIENDSDGFTIRMRTHPPTEVRVARLREIQADKERAA